MFALRGAAAALSYYPLNQITNGFRDCMPIFPLHGRDLAQIDQGIDCFLIDLDGNHYRADGPTFAVLPLAGSGGGGHAGPAATRGGAVMGVMELGKWAGMPRPTSGSIAALPVDEPGAG